MARDFMWTIARSETFAPTTWPLTEPWSTDVFSVTNPGKKDDGFPDGIKVDKNGNLFVTGPKEIWVWDANGNHLGTIVMPEQPTI
jgi:sugar lactone lactonase YvrE